jgi:hypothetical protein
MCCYIVPPACSSRECQVAPRHELRRLRLGVQCMVLLAIIKTHTLSMSRDAGQLGASVSADGRVVAG